MRSLCSLCYSPTMKTAAIGLLLAATLTSCSLPPDLSGVYVGNTYSEVYGHKNMSVVARVSRDSTWEYHVLLSIVTDHHTVPCVAPIDTHLQCELDVDLGMDVKWSGSLIDGTWRGDYMFTSQDGRIGAAGSFTLITQSF